MRKRRMGRKGSGGKFKDEGNGMKNGAAKIREVLRKCRKSLHNKRKRDRNEKTHRE